MKSIKKITGFLILIIFAAGINSCDTTDELNKLPVNIPFSIQIATSGSNTTISNTGNYCLENNSTYQDYKDDIESGSIKFLEASFRVVSFSPTEMRGNITATVKDASNNTLFTVTLPNVNPATFQATPYVFTLNQNQIEFMNTYLNSLNNKCFNGTVTVEITSGQPPYSLTGAIDIVIKADVEL